ncbi:hypothetical protein [Leucobacter viscericola]|uniref:hypothetical protein n=1 Tax=Leucobacter viscericola TaxID=2714935 RepID=UPI0019816701|nr:hypothetical protein [Leucobacter viscericola]
MKFAKATVLTPKALIKGVTLCIAGLLAATGLALGSSAAFAVDEPTTGSEVAPAVDATPTTMSVDTMTSCIGSVLEADKFWRGYGSDDRDTVSDRAATADDCTAFTFPTPGHTGTITYSGPSGETYCLDAENQPSPFFMLYWSNDPAANCQNVTTVADPDGTKQVSFMAADGEWQGRYLGDASGAGIVDWDQQNFSGVTIPDLPDPEPQAVTPAAPTLTPATACGVEPTVTVPEIDGVEYTQQRTDNTVKITAQATGDYVIAQGSETEWSFDVTAEACTEEPAQPKPTEPTEPPADPKPVSPPSTTAPATTPTASPSSDPAPADSASAAQLATTGTADAGVWIGLAAALLVAAASAVLLGQRARRNA